MAAQTTGTSTGAEEAYLAGTRTAYDTVAESYAQLVPRWFGKNPLDQAMLDVFVKLMRAVPADSGPVADLGCGPGHVTAYLHEQGVTSAFGVDLSPGMVAVARRSYPELRFEAGSMTDLDLPDGSLSGAVAWYSTVHTPPELLPKVFAEVHRVLAPGGRFLVAFKVGDLLRHLDHAYGHDLSLDVYWRDPEEVAALLADAGLAVEGRLVREPDEIERATQGRQASLLAVRAT